MKYSYTLRSRFRKFTVYCMLLSNASAYYMADKETTFLCNFACLILGNQTLSYQNSYTIHYYNLITSYLGQTRQRPTAYSGHERYAKKAIHSTMKRSLCCHRQTEGSGIYSTRQCTTSILVSSFFSEDIVSVQRLLSAGEVQTSLQG